MAICNDKLVIMSGDKQVRFTPLSTFTYKSEVLNLSGSSYNIAVSIDQSLIVIAIYVGISIIKNEKLVSKFKMEKESQIVSLLCTIPKKFINISRSTYYTFCKYFKEEP
ncbi:hypothetical protein ABK040_014632 [Willaertia magna]